MDHDKFNNDLSNLVLMTHEEHSRHHNDKHPRVRSCDSCGKEYEPKPTKRARSKTCSEECARRVVSQKAIEREARKRALREATP